MILYWGVLVGVFVLDLATKMVVRWRMPLGSEIKILPFFSLFHTENTGIAFGLFQGRNTFFLIMGTLVMTGIVWMGVRFYSQDRFSSLVFAMVTGGALGNLVDRFFFSRVTDFIEVYWNQYHWPTFNIADSAISVGAGLLLWRSLKRPPRPLQPLGCP